MHSGMHSFNHSIIHSFNHSFKHSFIHSFIRSFFFHSFIHSFIHFFMHAILHSSIPSCIPWFLPSFIHPFSRSFPLAVDIMSFLWHFNHRLTIHWCTSQPQSFFVPAVHRHSYRPLISYSQLFLETSGPSMAWTQIMPYPTANPSGCVGAVPEQYIKNGTGELRQEVNAFSTWGPSDCGQGLALCGAPLRSSHWRPAIWS